MTGDCAGARSPTRRSCGRCARRRRRAARGRRGRWAPRGWSSARRGAGACRGAALPPRPNTVATRPTPTSPTMKVTSEQKAALRSRLRRTSSTLFFRRRRHGRRDRARADRPGAPCAAARAERDRPARSSGRRRGLVRDARRPRRRRQRQRQHDGRGRGRGRGLARRGRGRAAGAVRGAHLRAGRAAAALRRRAAAPLRARLRRARARGECARARPGPPGGARAGLSNGRLQQAPDAAVDHVLCDAGEAGPAGGGSRVRADWVWRCHELRALAS